RSRAGGQDRCRRRAQGSGDRPLAVPFRSRRDRPSCDRQNELSRDDTALSNRPILTVTLNPALDVTTSTAKLHPRRKLRCSLPRYDPGGGGVNVSRAIK